MLVVEGLSKSFGATAALKNVTFSAAQGEVLAVLGENGAGKSTLVKILSGVTKPDFGSIELDGEQLRLQSPRDALRRRIVLIPQELAYLPALSVAENIVIGRWGSGGLLVSDKKMCAAALPYADAVGIECSLTSPVANLSLAEKQLVEIAKALARDARVLLLDEPTATLSREETNKLFATLEGLRRHAVVMIYISHRLDEVLEHADKILVLRDGVVASKFTASAAHKSVLIRSMLGREPAPAQAAKANTPTARTPLLTMQNVTHSGPGLRRVSLDVLEGEVLALFGVRGGGQESLVEMLAGFKPHNSGTVSIRGRVLKPVKSPRAARRAGILYVPPDRRRQGLIMMASISANVSLPQLKQLSRFGFMQRNRERSLLTEVAKTLGLQYRNGRQSMWELSGGNQQKILIGSRLYAHPALLVLHEPTRGVDVGARREIHSLLTSLTQTGVTVILATTDLEEAVEISHRLCIMRNGEIHAILQGGAKTQERALHEAVVSQ